MLDGGDIHADSRGRDAKDVAGQAEWQRSLAELGAVTVNPTNVHCTYHTSGTKRFIGVLVYVVVP